MKKLNLKNTGTKGKALAGLAAVTALGIGAGGAYAYWASSLTIGQPNPPSYVVETTQDGRVTSNVGIMGKSLTDLYFSTDGLTYTAGASNVIDMCSEITLPYQNRADGTKVYQNPSSVQMKYTYNGADFEVTFTGGDLVANTAPTTATIATTGTYVPFFTTAATPTWTSSGPGKGTLCSKVTTNKTSTTWDATAYTAAPAASDKIVDYTITKTLSGSAKLPNTVDGYPIPADRIDYPNATEQTACTTEKNRVGATAATIKTACPWESPVSVQVRRFPDSFNNATSTVTINR